MPAIPKLLALWIAMGTQEAKFIFRVTVSVWENSTQKAKESREVEKRGEKTWFGWNSRNQDFTCPGFPPKSQCGHLHSTWLSWLPLVAAGSNIPSQTHFIWPFRDGMRQSWDEMIFSHPGTCSGAWWVGEICTMGVHHGQKAPGISVAHKFTCWKQNFLEAYEVFLSHLWDFSKTFSLLGKG